jgi:hypothetical protein
MSVKWFHYFWSNFVTARGQMTNNYSDINHYFVILWLRSNIKWKLSLFLSIIAVNPSNYDEEKGKQ